MGDTTCKSTTPAFNKFQAIYHPFFKYELRRPSQITKKYKLVLIPLRFIVLSNINNKMKLKRSESKKAKWNETLKTKQKKNQRATCNRLKN